MNGFRQPNRGAEMEQVEASTFSNDFIKRINVLKCECVNGKKWALFLNVLVNGQCPIMTDVQFRGLYNFQSDLILN